MATTTPNFGWAVPTSTDLVKDGAVAIETLGDSIDASLVDLKGGTTGQVLSKATGTDMDFSWITPSTGGGGKSYSLLNAGGTALTGAATITVSGLSGYDDLLVLAVGASATGVNSDIWFRLNTDSGSNYQWGGVFTNAVTPYAASNFSSDNANFGTLFRLFQTNDTAATGTGSGSMRVSGANTTGIKAVTVIGASANDTGAQGKSYAYNGIYKGTSVISSVSIMSNNGNFDAGTIFVYGAV
jgi:hypothetical protein